MSTEEKVKYEDGYYMIHEEEFGKMLKVLAVSVSAFGKLPKEDVNKAVKEEMENHHLTEEEFSDFLIFMLELLKLELKK